MRTALVGAVESSRMALKTMLDIDMPPQLVVGLSKQVRERHSDYVDLSFLAEDAGLEYRAVTNINEESFVADLRMRNLDYLFVIGWSQICRPPLLDTPRKGTIGFHPSRLPINRGRAVIPWTILQKLDETGSTLFWIDEGVDSGDILAQVAFPVTERENARTLYDKHLVALEKMLRRQLPRLARGLEDRLPQDASQATFCDRRRDADGLIDWRASAGSIDALVRATTRPYPGAFTHCKGERIRIWAARALPTPSRRGTQPGEVVTRDPSGLVLGCGNDELLIVDDLTWEDGRPVDPVRFEVGTVLGGEPSLSAGTERSR